MTEPRKTESPRAGRRLVGVIDFRNTRFWVTLLVVLLIVLNALAFALYAAAFPKQDVALQLWTYAESDTAKLITASLILPLLIFVVEGRFNVAESVRASRVERARQAQDARRDARLETITLTSQAWNELYALTTRISSPGTLDYADLRTKLWNVPTTFNDLVTHWRVRFPNLPTEGGLVDSYIFLVNVVNECAASAAFHVYTAADDDARADVGGSIDLIASGFDQMLHVTIPAILNASLDLLAIRESVDIEELRTVESDAEAAALVEKYESEIRALIAHVEGRADWVRAHLSRRELLATVDGPEVSQFRRRFHELAAALRADPSRSVTDDPGLAELEASYDDIPRADRLHAWSVKYSPEWLAELADDLLFDEVVSGLLDPTLSPRS